MLTFAAGALRHQRISPSKFLRILHPPVVLCLPPRRPSLIHSPRLCFFATRRITTLSASSANFESSSSPTPSNSGEDGRLYPTAPRVAVSLTVWRAPFASLLSASPDSIEVLLVKRGKEPNKGFWSLPGGVVRLGEPLAIAAARELKEETGLTAAFGPPFGALENMVRDDDGRFRFHYVTVKVMGFVEDSSQEPQAADDAQSARWIQASQVAHLTPVTATSVETVSAALELLRHSLYPGPKTS